MTTCIVLLYKGSGGGSETLRIICLWEDTCIITQTEDFILRIFWTLSSKPICTGSKKWRHNVHHVHSHSHELFWLQLMFLCVSFHILHAYQTEEVNKAKVGKVGKRATLPCCKWKGGYSLKWLVRWIASNHGSITAGRQQCLGLCLHSLFDSYCNSCTEGLSLLFCCSTPPSSHFCYTSFFSSRESCHCELRERFI